MLQPTAMVGLLGCMAERLKEKLLETGGRINAFSLAESMPFRWWLFSG